MAFAKIVGGHAFGNSKASSASVTTAVFSNPVAADSLVWVLVAKDNVQTTDGETSEVTSITDTKLNTYTKVIEFCNGQGASNGGAVVSLWYSVITSGLTTSDTVTANFSSSITAKGVLAMGFSKGAGTTVSTTGTGTLANDGTNPGSLASTGLSSGTEYLTVRGIAFENDRSTVAFTNSASWTAFEASGGTTGGGNASNMLAYGEYIIASGATSQTSDPGSANCDMASVICSFYEVSATTAPVLRNPLSQIMPNLLR